MFIGSAPPLGWPQSLVQLIPGFSSPSVSDASLAQPPLQFGHTVAQPHPWVGYPFASVSPG